MLFKGLIRRYLHLKGWELVGEKPPFNKCVFVAAPHTSQIDFVYGKVFCSLLGMKPSFLIKKEAFWFPLGVLLRRLGGVPIERTSYQRIAQDLVKTFDDSDEMILIIAPEGTRKKVTRWKRGFHYIAHAANVPVVLTFVDHKEKRMGIGPVIELTDNFQEDIKRIKAFYRDMEGLHPERFSTDN